MYIVLQCLHFSFFHLDILPLVTTNIDTSITTATNNKQQQITTSMLDPQQEEKRKERRVRQMLNTYYGAVDGKMEGDIDPTSVDSMLFDVEKYFNDVLRGQNLPSIHSMMNKYQQGMTK